MANSLGDLVVTVGAQISGFTDAMKQVSDTLGSLGDTATSALERFDGVIDGLGEIAAAAGIATSAFEIAKEALEDFSKAQDVQTSFALLTGSAEDAESAFSSLKYTAIQLAIPFESLLSVAQRLVPQFGVGTEQLQNVLQAAGDAAAATGRDFSTIADGLDRIAVSGQVSTRQLIQFGVSIGDIATTMGVSLSQATDLLKKNGESAQADVDAVVSAIEDKFGGAADAIAQNLSGQFTNLKNELGFISEDLGASLAPLAEDLIAGLKDIEPTLKGIAEGVVPAADGFKNLATSISDLIPDFLKIIAGAPSMVALGTAFGFVADAAGTFVDVLHGAVLLMTDAVAALNPFSNGLQQFKQDWVDLGNTLYNDLSAKFQATAAAGQKAADALQGTTFAVKLDPSLAAAPAAIYGLSDAFKDLGVKIPPTQAELDKLANALEFIKSQYDSGLIPLQTYDAAVTDFAKKMNSLQGAFVAATLPVDDLGNALKLAGIANSANDFQKLTEAVAAAGAGYDIGRVSASDYAAAIDKLSAFTLKNATDGLAALQVQLTLTEEQFALGKVGGDALAASLDAVIQASPAYQDAWQKQGAAIAGFLVSIESVTQATPNVAQVLTSFGVETADQVAGHIKQLQATVDAMNSALALGVPGAALAAQLALQALRQEQEKLSAERLDDTILGIPNLTDLKNKLADVTSAYQDLSNRGLLNATTNLEAMIAQQKDAIAVATQQGQDTTNLRLQLDQMTTSLDLQTTASYNLAKQLGTTFGTDLSSALGTVIFQTGSISAAFEKMGEDIVTTVLDMVIKQAITPLATSLASLISGPITDLGKSLEGILTQLTGIGAGAKSAVTNLAGLGNSAASIGAPGTGAIGDTVGTGDTLAGVGAAGGLGGSGETAAEGLGTDAGDFGVGSDLSGEAADASGAAESAGGAADSAIGQAVGASIAPIMGIVTGAISAVTGVISIFQNMHQETSLNAIESNTRVGALYTLAAVQTLQQIHDFDYNSLFPELAGTNSLVSDILFSVAALPAQISAFLAPSLVPNPQLIDDTHNILVQAMDLMSYDWTQLSPDLYSIQTKLDTLNQNFKSNGANIGGQAPVFKIILNGQELLQSFVQTLSQTGTLAPLT